MRFHFFSESQTMKSIVLSAFFLVALSAIANSKVHTGKTLLTILRFIDHCNKNDDPKSCMKIGMEYKCRKNLKFIQKHQMASAVCECTEER